jgi:hypothetical protein
MRRMALWLAATITHFGLTVFWVRAFGARRMDRDDLVFHSAVIGLGSLQAILHTVAFSIGLSLGRGLAGIAVAHLAAAAVLAIRGRRAPDVLADHGEPPPAATRETRVLSAAGGIVLVALTVQWAIASASSLRVTGTDAAHYHVPYAVNIALGANPFGLPATPHLYPMGTSVLAAWFILPFRDPLLVDLANLLPFLLAWTAILRIVRDASGRPGSAWGPWLALGLFALPLFRHSLLVSADLFYASAFLAMNALLFGGVVRMRVDRADAISLGFATGMLVSTKVTGVFSAVALAVVYGLAVLVRTRLERRRIEWRDLSVATMAGAATLAVASGGIWLIRNWWSFGSPLAPSGLGVLGFEIFPGEKYGETMYFLSVLRDVRDTPGYSLASRAWYWAGVWIGHWFVAAGLLALAPIGGAVAARVRGRSLDDAQRARLAFTVASAALVAAHLVLLAGVPWSSLEWTDGFALRYALPCVALYGLVAFAAILPGLTGSRPLRSGAAVAVVALSIGWYVWHQADPAGAPEETLARLTPAGVVLGLAMCAVGYGAARLRRRPMVWAAAALVAAASVAAYSVHATRSDARLVRSAQAELDRLVACRTCDGLDLGDRRRVYLALLGYERSRGVACSGRRIFTTSRWDAPLDLQSVRFENQVFDVRGPAFTPRLLERDRPGTRPCDYVIAARAALDTTNGVPLVRMLQGQGRLESIAEAGAYVVFTRR